MTNVTIFCSTIPERHNLLKRSIESWFDSLRKAGVYYTLAIYCEGYDGSESWPKAMRVFREHSDIRSGSPEVGSNVLWNKYKDETDVAIFTHPEIMFGEDVVSQAVQEAHDKVYVTFRPFWIPKYLTEHWGEYKFNRTEDCEQCDEMYQYGPDPNGASRYLNQNIREHRDWQSDTTWAGNKSTIDSIFPVPQFGSWGPIDAYLAGARLRLGHRRVVPDACIYHQDHPRIEGGPPGHAVAEASRALRERFGG